MIKPISWSANLLQKCSNTNTEQTNCHIGLCQYALLFKPDEGGSLYVYTMKVCRERLLNKNNQRSSQIRLFWKKMAKDALSFPDQWSSKYISSFPWSISQWSSWQFPSKSTQFCHKSIKQNTFNNFKLCDVFSSST